MKEFNLFAWKENVSEPFYIKIQLRYRSLFCACEKKKLFFPPQICTIKRKTLANQTKIPMN